jgi:hypothetical protein
VTLQHNALREELATCQTKCARTRCCYSAIGVARGTQKAIEAKNECLNSVEDIECYHKTLIDMKEQYQKDVETFVKVTKRNLNHMHFAYILATSQATQMEAKLVKMQAKYCGDGRFQSHSLTFGPRYLRCFLTIYPRWQRIQVLIRQCIPSAIGNISPPCQKKQGNSCGPHLNPSCKMGNYALFGPEGIWILGTCQHMYHPQCLITLIMTRKRCSQCRAPFH